MRDPLSPARGVFIWCTIGAAMWISFVAWVMAQ